MTAHGIPEYPATTLRRMLSTKRQAQFGVDFFCILYLECIWVSEQRHESHGVLDSMSWRPALCRTHTLYTLSLMMWFVPRVSIKSACCCRGT